MAEYVLLCLWRRTTTRELAAIQAHVVAAHRLSRKALEQSTGEEFVADLTVPCATWRLPDGGPWLHVVRLVADTRQGAA